MRLADGGNADPAGRSFAVVVHGDSAGTEALRRALTDWLQAIQMIQAGALSCIDRMVGYMEPYATSHEALDKDAAVHEDVRNAARALHESIRQHRRGIEPADSGLEEPRPK
jgi:hypothetical protein